MRYINTTKRLKYLYWVNRKEPGTDEFFKLMQNPKFNSTGEAVFIIGERVKDLVHSLPVIGRFLFNDRNK